MLSWSSSMSITLHFITRASLGGFYQLCRCSSCDPNFPKLPAAKTKKKCYSLPSIQALCGLSWLTLTSHHPPASTKREKIVPFTAIKTAKFHIMLQVSLFKCTKTIRLLINLSRLNSMEIIWMFARAATKNVLSKNFFSESKGANKKKTTIFNVGHAQKRNKSLKKFDLYPNMTLKLINPFRLISNLDDHD
jgi:hypothetical protein